jgi:hypothetical protein
MQTIPVFLPQEINKIIESFLPSFDLAVVIATHEK